MILQELVRYFERRSSEPGSTLPPISLEWKEIGFAVVIDSNGRFVDIDDLRSGDKKPRGRACLVPQGETKGSGIKAQLMWENMAYLLGEQPVEKSQKKTQTTDEEKPIKGNADRVKKQHEAFKQRVKELRDSGVAISSVGPVDTFLQNLDIRDLRTHPLWEEIRTSGANLTFRIQGRQELVCENEEIHEYARNNIGSPDGASGVCLVTGKKGGFARLHPMIKGVYNAQSAGAAIVSFNKPSFESFNKEQGANAPVSDYAAAAYTSALNNLLARESRQKLLLGETTVAFWAEKPDLFETIVSDLFDDTPKEDETRYAEAIRNLYTSPTTGSEITNERSSSRFFVLGLSPNAARVSIRFWHVATISELAQNIRLYFDDLMIARPPWKEAHPKLRSLLLSTALRHERDNVDPSLPAGMLSSIFAGQPFPVSLAAAIIRRIRAERPEKYSSVTYERAALLKAYLNRQNRFYGGDRKEMTEELDETNTDTGYNLGRLFATLEKIQGEGMGELNAPIRDRYYSAASATPVTCFPLLMRMKNHHLAKIEHKGRAVNLEKMIGQIVSNINEFPRHLDLADQGRFAIGYYHQRHALYSKSTETQTEDQKDNDNQE